MLFALQIQLLRLKKKKKKYLIVILLFLLGIIYTINIMYVEKKSTELNHYAKHI